MRMKPENEFLTRKQAAAFLGLRPQTLANWMTKKWLFPDKKIENRTFYSIARLKNIKQMLERSKND